MRTIYSMAELVICWLGLPDWRSLKAFYALGTIAVEIAANNLADAADRISDLQWMEKHPWLWEQNVPGDSLENVSWNSITRMLKSEKYWTRVWILQELALARFAVIAKGPHSLFLDSLLSVHDWVCGLEGRLPKD